MIKRLLKDEKGIAMIVVIGIMVIVTALAFGAMAVSESDLLLSARDKESMQALHIAEAGIQRALWQLEQSGNDIPEKVFTVSVGNGSAQVDASQAGSKSWYWTIESTGTCGNAHRRIKVNVFNFSIWNMNMGLSGNKSLASGGNGMHGTTSITGPFYVRGNVELSGNSSITEGPLFIKTGSLVLLNNSSTLGQSVKPVDAFIEPTAGNGDIIDSKGALILKDPSQKQVYVSQLLNQVPDIKLPPMDELSKYRGDAASESSETVTSWHPDANPTASGGYKVLDTDNSFSGGTVDARHTYKLNNDIGTFGTTTCGFAWVNNHLSGNNNELYVYGTVFVDGNLEIGENENDTTEYIGNGTIVVNGKITIKGELRPKTYSMDGNHVLGLVTSESITISANCANSGNPNTPNIAGAFYASKEVSITRNNITFVGSMIAGTLNFADGTNNSHLFTDDRLPTFLPPSLPGKTKYLAMTAAWREVN